MPEKISRRELARRGLLGAAALAVPSLLPAQETQPAPKPDPEMDRKIEAIESKLAKPLSPRAKEILRSYIGNSEGAATSRLKHRLPENSEPCFTFLVTPAPKR